MKSLFQVYAVNICSLFISIQAVEEWLQLGVLISTLIFTIVKTYNERNK